MTQRQRIARAAMSLGGLIALVMVIGSPLDDRRRRRHARAVPDELDRVGREGRAASLADRAGAVGATARGCWWPTRRPDSVSLVDTQVGQGAPRAQDRREARRGGDFARRPARGGHALVRLRSGDARARARPDRRSPAASRSVPSRGASCMTADGKTAFVAVGVSNEVVRVDLDDRKVTGRLAVGREPRGIALSPDGSRLLGRQRALAERLDHRPRSAGASSRTIPIDGDNLRQVADQRRRQDGLHRQHAQSRVRHDQEQHRPGLGARPAADPRCARRLGARTPRFRSTRRARPPADAHGVAVSRDSKFVAVSCGGTHEVMIFRTDLQAVALAARTARAT